MLTTIVFKRDEGRRGISILTSSQGQADMWSGVWCQPEGICLHKWLICWLYCKSAMLSYLALMSWLIHWLTLLLEFSKTYAHHWGIYPDNPYYTLSEQEETLLVLWEMIRKTNLHGHKESTKGFRIPTNVMIHLDSSLRGAAELSDWPPVKCCCDALSFEWQRFSLLWGLVFLLKLRRDY